MTEIESPVGPIMGLMGLAAAVPLVGRGEEYAALVGSLARGRAAEGRAVVVGGDAGVGKTRLVREVIAAADAAGDLVLVGHCVQVGGETLPYLPMREVFGRLRRSDPAAVVDLVERHPPLAWLLPAGPADTQSPRLAGAELFESVVGAIIDLAAERPVVLVIEDVHWIDPSSRDLVGFLLTRLSGERVTVVLSVRTDDLHRRHPVRSALAEWSRLPDVSRVSLLPFNRADLHAFVAAQHPEPLPDTALARIFDRSGGNPFFAEQLIAEVDRGEAVPADLADLLLVRLERLSPEARQAVRTAAVAGRQIPYPLLDEVVPLAPDVLEMALREAVDAHVLVATGTRGYEFHHALLAEAVYDDLLPGERVRLHAAFAQALSERADPAADADLARHARASLDLPAAFAAGVRAGDAALRVAAPAEALELYESALQLASQVPDVDLVGLTLKTAEAASLSGDPFRAAALTEDVLGVAPWRGDQRAELLIALAEYQLRLDLPADPSQHSAAALELIDADPPTPLRARALMTHAHALAMTEHPRDALLWATEALNVGHALGLPTVIADASTTLARASAKIGEPDAAVRLLRESIAAAHAAGDAATEIRGLHGLGGLDLEQGDLEGALVAYADASACAVAAGRPWAAYALDSHGLRIHLLSQRGRLDEALVLAGEGVAPPPYARAFLRAMALGALVARGDEGVEAGLAEAARWAAQDGMLTINAAFAEIEYAGRRGDVERAVAVHDQAVVALGRQWQETWFAGRIRLHTLLLGQLPPAELARGRRLVADAHRAAAEVSRRQPYLGPEAQAWVVRADAEWARLRWLAGTVGPDAPDAEELVGAWRAAVEGFGYGDTYEQTRSRIRLAEVLAGVGDAAAARDEADLALASARAMGATPLIEALRRRAPRPAQTELTPREEQVLALLVEGGTNRQIGRQLFIADKTVSVHVSNILAKLGAASRTEAAALARRDGLI